MSIADLVRDVRLEEIDPDAEEAGELIAHAVAHLDSASAIHHRDPAGAYQLAYDAARKAVSAHMVASGYRTTARPRAHAAAVEYAEEALAGVAAERSLANLDRMRRLRNRSEYSGITLGANQINTDIAHASEIVRAVQRWLESRPR